MTPEAAIDTILTRVSGEIVGCNIVAGVENGLIQPRLAKDAFEWLGHLAANRGYRGPTELVDALRILRSGDFPPSMSGSARPPDFRLRGTQALNARDLLGGLSSILPAYMLDDLILPDDLESLRAEGLVFPAGPGPLLDDAIEEWREKSAAERRARLDPNQTMGGHRSVVWFTRRRDLKASLVPGTPHICAQLARDRLGLVHYGPGVVLAAMHFPDEIFRRSTSARPTFLDAADSRRFRTWPDGRKSRSNHQWGCTVDLAALARSDPDADGCPERVTTEIAGATLPDDGWFEVELLGAVADSTGEDPADDVAFSARLRGQLGGLSVDDLRAKLKSYL